MNSLYMYLLASKCSVLFQLGSHFAAIGILPMLYINKSLMLSLLVYLNQMQLTE